MYQRSESAAPYLYAQQERRDEGMRNLLNMFMMSKQMEEERGEKEWERGFEERKQELAEKIGEAQVRRWDRSEPTDKMSQWEFRLSFAKELLDNNIINQEEFNKYTLTGQLDKGISEYQKTLQREKKIGERRGILDDAIKAYESRIKQKSKPMSDTELIILAQKGIKPDFDIDDKAVESLNLGLAELRRLRGLLEEGRLSDKEFTEALNIFSRMNIVEESGPFWDRGSMQTSGIPFEVQEYMEKHPDISYGEALELWRKFKLQ